MLARLLTLVLLCAPIACVDSCASAAPAPDAAPAPEPTERPDIEGHAGARP